MIIMLLVYTALSLCKLLRFCITVCVCALANAKLIFGYSDITILTTSLMIFGQILEGAYGLFAGQAGDKLVAWLVLPSSSLAWLILVIVMLKSQKSQNSAATWQDLLKRHLRDALSTQWHQKNHGVKRMLKH